MYEAYFGLNQKPFELVPNPDFLFLSKSHKRALTYLDYGISERVGFILLTGEVGSGKTTIIRDLINKHHEQVVLSKVFNTRVNSEQLIALINDDFGISSAGRDKTTMLRDLNDFLVEQYARGNFPVLIIDEAQNLTPKLLEEIRMLSNLETDSAKLLQIILVGQPELRETIGVPALRQLRQRISINCHLQPLSRQEMELYILHRLEIGGNRTAVTFTGEAFDLIFASSRGIPRLINIICDFLMISAFAEETNMLDASLVREIIIDLDFESHFWESDPKVEDRHTTQDKPLSRTASGDYELVQTLKGINLRLDSIECDVLQTTQSSMREFGQKLTELQNAFMFHVKETDLTINTISTKVEKLRNLKDETDREGESTNKSGFVRRLIG